MRRKRRERKQFECMPQLRRYLKKLWHFLMWIRLITAVLEDVRKIFS